MPRARHVRFLVLFREDLPKVRPAVERAARNGRAADAAPVLGHDFRADAQDSEDDADDDEEKAEHERLLEHQRRNQLGKRLLRVCGREDVQDQDENDRPEAGAQKCRSNDFRRTLISSRRCVQASPVDDDFDRSVGVGS